MRTDRILSLVLCAGGIAGAASAQQQPYRPALRNTFVVATESVIDMVSSVDIHAEPAAFDAAMKSAQTARATLQQMATEEGEQEVVASVGDLFFAVSACHIQAIDHADTATCQHQIANARDRAMDRIDKHKSQGAWVDGPPLL